MKLKLLFGILMFQSVLAQAQEIFTDSFAGQGAPFSLHTINDELYVGLFDVNANNVAYIQKVPFNDPTNKITVAEATSGIGFIKLAYDENSNILIGGTPSSLYKINLNDALPIQTEAFNDTSVDAQLGLILSNSTLYFVRDNTILKYSLNDTEYTETEVFENDNQIIIGEIYNDELYFFERTENGSNLTLYKIDITASSPTPVLVSNMEGYNFGFAQDVYLKNSLLYATIESSANHSIIKFDLEDALPVTPELVVTPDNAPLGITSYESNLYYITGTQKIFFIEDPELLNTNEFKKENSIVYPNPVVNDRLYIRSRSSDNFQLIDINGKIVLQGTRNREAITLHNINSGVYFLKLFNRDGEVLETQKVIKK